MNTVFVISPFQTKGNGLLAVDWGHLYATSRHGAHSNSSSTSVSLNYPLCHTHNHTNKHISTKFSRRVKVMDLYVLSWCLSDERKIKVIQRKQQRGAYCMMPITSSRPALPAPSHRSFVETFKILLDWLGGIPHLLSNDTLQMWVLFMQWYEMGKRPLLRLNQDDERCWEADSEFNPCLYGVDICFLDEG